MPHRKKLKVEAIAAFLAVVLTVTFSVFNFRNRSIIITPRLANNIIISIKYQHVSIKSRQHMTKETVIIGLWCNNIYNKPIISQYSHYYQEALITFWLPLNFKKKTSFEGMSLLVCGIYVFINFVVVHCSIWLSSEKWWNGTNEKHMHDDVRQQVMAVVISKGNGAISLYQYQNGRVA